MRMDECEFIATGKYRSIGKECQDIILHIFPKETRMPFRSLNWHYSLTVVYRRRAPLRRGSYSEQGRNLSLIDSMSATKIASLDDISLLPSITCRPVPKRISGLK